MSSQRTCSRWRPGTCRLCDRHERLNRPFGHLLVSSRTVRSTGGIFPSGLVFKNVVLKTRFLTCVRDDNLLQPSPFFITVLKLPQGEAVLCLHLTNLEKLHTPCSAGEIPLPELYSAVDWSKSASSWRRNWPTSLAPRTESGLWTSWPKYHEGRRRQVRLLHVEVRLRKRRKASWSSASGCSSTTTGSGTSGGTRTL